MARRIARAKVGDVYEVKLSNERKAYFQFVVVDRSQLNSEVIAVFKNIYPMGEIVDLDKEVKSEVSFFAHVSIKQGLKRGQWSKSGNVPVLDILKMPNFKSCSGFGHPEVDNSNSWYVWTPNNEYNRIGSLGKEHEKYDLGEVFPSFIILEQIENDGEYPYSYP